MSGGADAIPPISQQPQITGKSKCPNKTKGPPNPDPQLAQQRLLHQVLPPTREAAPVSAVTAQRCRPSSCQHLSDSLAPLGQFRGTERTQPLLHLRYQTSCSLTPPQGRCSPIAPPAPRTPLQEPRQSSPNSLRPSRLYRGQKAHLFPPHEQRCPSALLTVAPRCRAAEHPLVSSSPSAGSSFRGAETASAAGWAGTGFARSAHDKQTPPDTQKRERLEKLPGNDCGTHNVSTRAAKAWRCISCPPLGMHDRF